MDRLQTYPTCEGKLNCVSGQTTEVRKGAVPNDSIDEHVKSLSSSDAAARAHGREQLVKIGAPAAAAVVGLLSHPQQHARWEACKTLEGIADPSAAAPLVEAMADSDQDVRWVAGAALIPLGRDGLEPLLVALIDKDRVVGLQAAAHHVAHELGQGELGEIVAPLLEALSGPDVELVVPVAAEKTLQRFRSA
jgi:HEAT repeat protein